MTAITTPRLIIKPTHTNCWAIYDKFDDQLIGKLFFRKQWFNILMKPQSLHLGVASEASYHLLRAVNSSSYKARTDVKNAQAFLYGLGFEQHENHFLATSQSLKSPEPYYQLNQQLGIDISKIKPPFQNTAAQLIDSDIDCFRRPTKLHPKADEAWQKMKQAADDSGVQLQLVSAFRSLNYQAGLIQKKLDNNLSLSEILTTNAAPGHSEHHTGRAIDITTPDIKPLEEAFEQSAAFKWLNKHGKSFGFSLSYPRNNDLGMIYEPWHWCFN